MFGIKVWSELTDCEWQRKHKDNSTYSNKHSSACVTDESLTKHICPVTSNTSYETTALSIVTD